MENICLENSEFSQKQVIEALIADYKGQISNNNFMQFVSLIFSVLVIVLGFVRWKNIRINRDSSRTL